jgi:hypothetical protein
VKKVTAQDIQNHFLPPAKPANVSRPAGVIVPPIHRDKIQESRILLWEALRVIGQVKHENQNQPVVDNHLKEADEKVRAALRLIL